MSLCTSDAPGAPDKQWFSYPLVQSILFNLRPWIYIYPYSISAYEFPKNNPNCPHTLEHWILSFSFLCYMQMWNVYFKNTLLSHLLKM